MNSWVRPSDKKSHLTLTQLWNTHCVTLEQSTLCLEYFRKDTKDNEKIEILAFEVDAYVSKSCHA